jgi:hypothetical protein
MVAPEYSWDSFPMQSQRGIPKQSKPIESTPQMQGEPAPSQVDTLGNAPEQQPEPEYSWGQFDTPTSFFEAKEDEKESNLGMITRNLTANLFRIGEQVSGRYGNMIEFGKSVLENYPSTAGLLGQALYSFVGPEKWKSMIRGPEDALSMKVPTSEDVKKLTKAATGEYTEPRGSKEKAVQEFVSDASATISGGRPTARSLAINTLGIPAAANAVKQIVGGLGFGEDKAILSKLGAWTALSLLGNVNGREYATQQVRQARDTLPHNLTVDLNRYLPRLNALEQRFLASDPRSQAARQQINAIRQDIQNGQISIHDLFTQYDGINAVKNTRGFFEIGQGPQRAAATRNLDEVRHVVRDMIEETGNQYPQAIHQWRNGMQSLAVIHQSQRMTNWIKNTLTGEYGKLAGSAVAGLFGAGAYHNPATAVVGAAGAAAAYKTYQVAHRVWNDPRLSQYYWNAISAAQAQNNEAFIKNMNALDREYKEKEKKNSFAM